jgi:molybdopterin-containing oxidoreductase family membrane subunit
MTFGGTLGLFTLLFLLFVRFLPMIPMSEIRLLLPGAKITPHNIAPGTTAEEAGD